MPFGVWRRTHDARACLSEPTHKLDTEPANKPDTETQRPQREQRGTEKGRGREKIEGRQRR